jgi:hypothetical protein
METDVLTMIVRNPGVQLLAALTATMVLSYAANYWLARVFAGKLYRYLIAPGVVVHEYSHALACLLVGARIKEVRLFEASGGRVVHEEPKLPFGQGLISTAPVIGAAAVAYGLAYLLVPGFLGFGELELASWQFLAFAYLGGSVVAAMAPSKQDLTVGLGSFVAICLVLGLASLSPALNDYFSFLDGFWEGLRRVLEFALVMLALLAGAAGGTYLLLGRTIRKGAKYEPLD